MVEGERPPLILRRIQSYWSDWKSPDDYTVHVDGEDQAVGRIFRRNAAHPEGLPWMWTVEFHQRKGRAEPHQGDAPDLDAAMAAFRHCWNTSGSRPRCSTRGMRAHASSQSTGRPGPQIG
jgi:hypothetical protein